MNECQIVVIRDFPGSNHLLFEAWTIPEQIGSWYGPEGFLTRVSRYDFVEGGQWEFAMTGPDGGVHPVHGVFEVIDAPNRLVISDGWEDDPNGRSGMMQSMEFRPEPDDRSELVLTMTLPTSAERERFERMGVVQGWQSSFDRLDAFLAAKTRL